MVPEVRVGWNIGREQTYRLTKRAGIAGSHRARKPITTRAAKTIDDRPDLVRRDFTAIAPNRLRVADFTYVRTYSGFCYTAFITDVFSRKIVGWGVSSTMHTLGMPLTALRQVLFEAKRDGSDFTEIVHHSDRGSQVALDDDGSIVGRALWWGRDEHKPIALDVWDAVAGHDMGWLVKK